MRALEQVIFDSHQDAIVEWNMKTQQAVAVMGMLLILITLFSLVVWQGLRNVNDFLIK
jgi:hypothetical protein